jgi:hypothetical protein
MNDGEIHEMSEGISAWVNDWVTKLVNGIHMDDHGEVEAEHDVLMELYGELHAMTGDAARYALTVALIDLAKIERAKLPFQ